ncbi:hypothetical protein FUA48_08680 [Flavobacterium alkalisoli]|uniref:Uncharacterized protein n=1 Tax=Flavobacterium alkalisoli TaxID=2602769 RepID=A0A5B9FU90_9FLAO|nr:hypothetical protein [Flavobacterium alkalisoli]QEE49656.1 hypothetical protein FUA48_08680 [Flavobacterium alkalisoli]
MENTNLKPLPFSVKKGELVEMYIDQMTERFILDNINTIIVATRNLPKNYRPRVSQLLHIEFMEFVATYGAPKGYEKPKVF